MKAENDKRNVRTSVTMTQNDSETIAKNAKERGLSVSSYMVLSSVHPNQNTPETMVKYQNIINYVCMIMEEVAPERIDEVRKEAEDIWSL
ncbi:MAG: hypothetical protein IKH75_18980 [Ruminococcus sp.]|nr:hypothetical protein [Ruminococcus sp.]